jgi:hypothetical protein
LAPYEALERCIDALTELTDAKKPAEPMFDLVDRCLVNPIWKATEARFQALIAYKPKNRFEAELRAVTRHLHAIHYDIPDKDKIAILLEALTAVVEKEKQEGKGELVTITRGRARVVGASYKLPRARDSS